MKVFRSLLPVVLALSGCVGFGAGPAGAAVDPLSAIHGYFVARDEARFGALAHDVRTFTTTVPGGRACPGAPSRTGSRSFRTSAATLLTWNAGAPGDSSIADDYDVCVRRSPAGGYRVHDVRTVSAAPHTETGAGTGAGTGTAPPVPGGTAHRYDADAAARYALAWSGTLVQRGEPVPQYNPDYPRLDDDSANFVSQALEAGGWRRSGDGPAAWTPVAGGRSPGTAWSRPADLFRFAVDRRAHPWGRSTPHSDDIWSLMPGDLMFVDWTSDGAVDHALIVVGRDTVLGFTEPTISQHSPHRHNLPLSIAIKIDALEHDAMSFYPVTPHASYRDGGPGPRT